MRYSVYVWSSIGAASDKGVVKSRGTLLAEVASYWVR